MQRARFKGVSCTMNFEDQVHLNWTNAVFYFTHNFFSYEHEVVNGLISNSSEVRCASIAVLNQSNSVKCRDQIFDMLSDESQTVIEFALEYFQEFGLPEHSKKILTLINEHPFNVSNALANIFPDCCGIILEDDEIKEKERIIQCWESAITKYGN